MPPREESDELFLSLWLSLYQQYCETDKQLYARIVYLFDVTLNLATSYNIFACCYSYSCCRNSDN